jgi:hypothetical protein
MPPDGANRTLVRVKDDHSLRGEHAVIADAIRAWLGRVPDLGSRTPPP